MSARRMLCVLVCVIAAAGCSKNAAPVASRGEMPDVEEAPSTATPATSGTQVSPHDESPAEAESDGQLTLDRVVLAVPAGWQQNPAASSFVLAEYSLPPAEGDDAPGRLTVSVAGGSIEANVERWRGQFGGNPEKESEDRSEIDGMEVVLVDFVGEFKDQRGPFAPATMRSGYRMLAAIISVDGELHFVKATGPQATIAAHESRFHDFIESVKKR